jgi:1-acyl-sn-glycerol-3-phosphate acyltransferase
MMSFIAGMCISLPLTLFPPWILWKLGLFDRIQKEKAALRTGQYCARFLSKIIPFVHVQIEGSPPKQEPSVWVCNHSSMLDIFILLANYNRLSGNHNQRPIKIVYVRTAHTPRARK